MKEEIKNKTEVVTISLKKLDSEPQKVLLKDLGFGDYSQCCGTEFGYKIKYEMRCDDWDAFFSVMEIDWLERLLKSAMDDERFEMAEVIKKHINLKNK